MPLIWPDDFREELAFSPEPDVASVWGAASARRLLLGLIAAAFFEGLFPGLDLAARERFMDLCIAYQDDPERYA